MTKAQTRSTKQALESSTAVRSATRTATIETRRQRAESTIQRSAAAISNARPSLKTLATRTRRAASHMPRVSQIIKKPAAQANENIASAIRPDKDLWTALGLALGFCLFVAGLIIGWFWRSMS